MSTKKLTPLEKQEQEKKAFMDFLKNNPDYIPPIAVVSVEEDCSNEDEVKKVA